MENYNLGIVIKVNDLGLCRQFYRDVLLLGFPVIDSNLWVEFQLPGNSFLALEKVDDNIKMPPAESRQAWIYKMSNAIELIDRLKAHGYTSECIETDKMGFVLYQFVDPEENPFYIYVEIDKTI